ncbi:MAG: DUF2066 domain-containing protein [Steroidobacteraceae bacterium]
MLRAVAGAVETLAFVPAVGVLALAAVLSPARASRPVDVYQVTVPAGTAVDAIGQAMRQVLVRATGRRDASTDPALAPLVTGAGQYVLSAHPAGTGTFQVTFDGPQVEQRIVAAHRSVWGTERPFTIVVLAPPPTGTADEAVRQSLEQIAAARGLPTALVPLAVTDSTGNPLSDGTLLASAQRLGGDDVLIGRTNAAAPSGDWQWTLVTGIATSSWNGTFADGINGAADTLALVGGSAIPLAVENADIEVSGVATLADYAAVEQMLADLPGVRRSGLVAADGTTATFEVRVRGGALAVAQALAHASRLVRASPSDAPLAYRFQP